MHNAQLITIYMYSDKRNTWNIHINEYKDQFMC